MKRWIYLALFMIAFFPAINTPKIASADKRAYFIICTPKGDVNVRKHAKIKSEAIGGLDFGKEVLSDCKERNGFIHVIDLAAEDSTGWVHSGYMVEDKPIACHWIGYATGLGKIRARKCINGKVINRIDPGSEVMIYAYSEQWCVTEYGFIRTEFLEIQEQESCY